MIVYAAFMLIGGLVSCSYRDEIDEINDRVDAIENTLSKLQKAYSDGKIISDVRTVEATSGRGGYQIYFSDGTSIELNHGTDGETGQDGNNGQDGVTPLIKIDSEGYWTVSYNDGETHSRIIDTLGNPVSAIGQKGEPGVVQPGTDGTDGKDGIDGKDGQCVRVVQSADGYYVFETYNPSSPETVLDRIVTPYKSNRSSVISSIVQNEKTGIITLTMEDGVSYDFNLDVAYPTGIVVLNETLVINWSKSGTITFRLNPSDAFINFVTSGDDANIFLDVVSEYAGRSIDETSYVHGATGYRISEVSECVNSDGMVMRGQYSAKVLSNNNGENADDRVCLVVKTKNSKGGDIYLSSLPFKAQNGDGNEIAAMSIGDVEAVKDGSTFLFKMPSTTNLHMLKPSITSSCTSLRIKGSDKAYSADDAVNFSNPVTFVSAGPDGTEQEYTAVVHFSNLPVVYMNTPSAITSKEVWTADCEMQIWNAGDKDGLYQKVNVKGRGNSTWRYPPKKPYAIKLSKKAEVLGMPKHKRWCLLANYRDKTIMRNDLVFEIGHRMKDGLGWTPHGKFVDVVLNGNFLGNYYLCEQIEVDENRVNIAELTDMDLNGDAITGGYLLEIDNGYDEVNKFWTDKGKLPINFKEPDEEVLQPQQFEYVKNLFDDIESKLYGEEVYDFDQIGELIDYNSFADYWILFELLQNREMLGPRSCYSFKDRGGKLHMGPVWDFDMCLQTLYYEEFFALNKSLWYSQLFRNESFVELVKSRWSVHRTLLETIPDYIDTRYAEIQESAEMNSLLWPINIYIPDSNLNGDEKMGYKESVEDLKRKYKARFEIMDAAIAQM